MAKIKNRKQWKEKCDGLWSIIVRSVGYCEICGRSGAPRKDGRPIKGLDPHHLLGKGAYPQFWHDVNNGVSLCVRCHIWGSEVGGVRICAHGDIEQLTNFWAWIEKNKPATHEWYLENKDNKKSVVVDYEEKYAELQEMMGPEW